MHANAHLTPRARLELCSEIARGRSVASVAAEFRVSRTTAYRWWRRFAAHPESGQAGLVDRSSRPRRCHGQTPRRVEAQIVALRRREKLGPARIAYRLGLNPATVQRVLVRHQLNRLDRLHAPTGFTVECTERSGQDFEVVRLGEATAIQYFTDNPDAAVDAWPTARILYDPQGRLAVVRDHALAIIAEGKPPLEEARLEYLRLSSADQVRAAARLAPTDVAGSRLVLYDKVRDLTSMYFDVRQMWTPHLKRRMASILELDPEFHELLQHLFATDTSLDEQLRLARIAVGLVFREELA